MGFMRIDASLAAAEQDTFIAGTVRPSSRGPQVALRRSPFAAVDLGLGLAEGRVEVGPIFVVEIVGVIGQRQLDLSAIGRSTSSSTTILPFSMCPPSVKVILKIRLPGPGSRTGRLNRSPMTRRLNGPLCASLGSGDSCGDTR
jgi:hypothetical protein